MSDGLRSSNREMTSASQLSRQLTHVTSVEDESRDLGMSHQFAINVAVKETWGELCAGGASDGAPACCLCCENVACHH